MPPQQIFTDPAEAERATISMATAMRTIRANAREGDIFDQQVASEFRNDIWRALRDAGVEVHDLAEEMIPEVPADYPPPVVNGNFSWALANATPP